jgi:large subunit ribosomal protein L21
MAEIAVIKTGGKQYKVAVGDMIKVEKILGKKDKLEFEDILGGKKVAATVIGEGRRSKIRVLKFRPKKRYKRVGGHIQNFTSIKIESIK